MLSIELEPGGRYIFRLSDQRWGSFLVTEARRDEVVIQVLSVLMTTRPLPSEVNALHEQSGMRVKFLIGKRAPRRHAAFVGREPIGPGGDSDAPAPIWTDWRSFREHALELLRWEYEPEQVRLEWVPSFLARLRENTLREAEQRLGLPQERQYEDGDRERWIYRYGDGYWFGRLAHHEDGTVTLLFQGGRLVALEPAQTEVCPRASPSFTTSTRRVTT